MCLLVRPLVPGRLASLIFLDKLWAVIYLFQVDFVVPYSLLLYNTWEYVGCLGRRRGRWSVGLRR